MNYYEILGVTADSNTSEIKAAYRKLVRKYHPDVNPAGEKRFKDISKAYDVLSDEAKRRQYDTLNGFFKPEKTKTSSNKAEEAYSKQPQDKPKKQTRPKPKKQKKNEKKISDIFNSIFESSKETNIKPENGTDINTDVTITLAEAVQGCSKMVNIVHTEFCPRCKGRKFINGAKCSVCSGTGEYSRHKRINVKIPEDVKNGAKLRIKGEGNEGRFGGKNGDLYLHIQVELNPRIQYEDLNILYNIPITPYEAVLGGDIVLPDGHVKLKLPPRTSSGQKFRLAGQGLKKNGKTGDMIVIVTIEIPKRLSDDEVKLYEKLKKMAADDIRET